MQVPISTKKIEVICPICKTRDLIGIPEKKLRNSSHLTTVSIQKGLVCPHHFQIFIDKNLQVRGYQKVDFELNQDNSAELRNGVKVFNGKRNKNVNHFENITIDYRQKVFSNKKNESNITNYRNLKDIYEEFWEFIGDDNEKFQIFIRNDIKRKNLSK
ncbi:MAG: hypothetical protein ACFFE4_02205 [Candidatus Thorarchaeota archaeon]